VSFDLTEGVPPVGRRVVHRGYGWTGTVGRFAHTAGMVMVLWDADHGGGASLWAYKDLSIDYEGLS